MGDSSPSETSSRQDVGFGSVILGLWVFGVWVTTRSSLGPWESVLLALSGLPLLALLLDRARSRSTLAKEGAALAAPIAMLWILNHRALDFWWMTDDPCNLLDAIDNGLLGPFVTPVGNFLQPLLSLSLGLDLELFGLDPRAFYIHQLIAFTILLGVAYRFLRAFLETAAACLALTLFVTSAPAIAVAQQQMNRHYLEGLILMLASFVCYRRAVVDQRWRWAAAGAALYLLATAAKEVFVPLIVVLPFLTGWHGSPAENVHRRRYMLPYALVLGFYAWWRLSLLGRGNSLSAYGVLSGELDLGSLMQRLPRLLGWTDPWLAMTGAVLLAAAAWVLCRRSLFFATGLGVTMAAVALPLIPIAGRLEPRHLWVPAFAAASVVAAAINTSTTELGDPWRRRLRTAAGVGLMILGLVAVAGAPILTNLEKLSQRYQTEGRFLLDGTRDGMLLTRLPHSHHLQCLARLSRERLDQTSGPGFCGDLCFCTGSFPQETFWEVAEGGIVEVERTPGESCDTRRPLAVDMHHDDRQDQLSWDLKPLDGGTYQALLLSDGVAPGISIPISIPRQGHLPYRLSEPLRFVLIYRSPEGWRTYSHVHVVEPGGTARKADDVQNHL